MEASDTVLLVFEMYCFCVWEAGSGAYLHSLWTQNCKADRDAQSLSKLHLYSRECEVCNAERAISGPSEAVLLLAF